MDPYATGMICGEYECICSGGTFVAQVDDGHWTLAGVVVLRSADPTTS
jgi:hypothetical protein